MTSTIEEQFTVDGSAELIVSCPSGSVTVVRGEADRVEVTVDTRRPDDWSIRQSGGTVEVRHEGGGWMRDGRARVRVAIPEQSDVTIKTASADVDVSVVTRRCQVASASGDVAVGIAGKLMVKTASGDVRAEQIATDGAFSTASGDVNASSVFGDVEATTASGDVRLGTVIGAAKIATASGEISVARYEGADLVANSSSGDIAIGLPTGRTVELDAKTLSGHVQLPPRREGGPSAGPRVSIRAKTVSGDVTLRRA